ncbi:hypothetical protein POTOM_040385 [Populus tomentosa]|uniref:TF-B3 domain-containing protein n=1 Tax=Populus tomentosa TaxID=118781 RepID=A0A8X7YTZ6_POPTO|nr:hypothetical protein POTOM_040385 [Populus tomentosa]
MEVMAKLLSGSDTTNKRLEFPTESLGAFSLPAGQNSVEFDALDMLDQPWRLKISVRNKGRYPKPWISGQWSIYVHQKKLRQGDRVTLTVHNQENGVKNYRIIAERKHFGFWKNIESSLPPFGYWPKGTKDERKESFIYVRDDARVAK